MPEEGNEVDSSARRPLKSRAARWAVGLSRGLVRTGVSPNSISVASVGFALIAGGMLIAVGLGFLCHWWLLGAAAMIQARLVCNLMDGMVAIEGGRKSATGDLFNEVPDRFADMAILAAAGVCAWFQPWGFHLGWLAAALAVTTAYVRVQGALLTGRHDFRGPMAKPQRMALVTATSVIAAIWPCHVDWFLWVLGLIVVGELLTLVRRLRVIAAELERRTP